MKICIWYQFELNYLDIKYCFVFFIVSLTCQAVSSYVNGTSVLVSDGVSLYYSDNI